MSNKRVWEISRGRIHAIRYYFNAKKRPCCFGPYRGLGPGEGNREPSVIDCSETIPAYVEGATGKSRRYTESGSTMNERRCSKTAPENECMANGSILISGREIQNDERYGIYSSCVCNREEV